MVLLEGGDIAKAVLKAKGEEIILTGGRYAGGTVYNHPYPVKISAVGFAIIVGGKGLKFEGCKTVELGGFSVQEAAPHGIMIVRCGAFQASRLTILKSAKNNLLTANTSNVSLTLLVCDHAVEGHGIYLSQSGDNLEIWECISRYNARSGIQINGRQDGRNRALDQDGISRNVTISGNVLIGNQTRYGAAAITLAACRDLSILNNRIEEHEGRHGIACWADGTGKQELACQSVLIDGNSFNFAADSHPEACVSIRESCLDIHIGKSNRFPNSVTKLVTDTKSKIIR